jgi:hypothetical protein
MWAGNTNGDALVVAAGAQTDVNAITSKVFIHPDNTNASPSFEVPGYHTEDIDMNGKVVLSGAETDVFLITSNVLLHPENNPAFSDTYEVKEQNP